VELDTKALDFESVRASLGSWKKDSRIILWDSRMLPELRALGPYREGRAEFWVKVKDDFSDLRTDDRNLIIISRITIGREKEEFRVPVNSKIELTQQAFYTMPDEVLAYFPSDEEGKKTENIGPAPPVVGETTSYTILWSLKNYFNNLTSVKVRATLPPYVKAILGESDIRQGENELIWDLGEVAMFQGVNSPPLVRVFQIEVTPPETSIGEPLVLIEKVKIEAEDDFTKAFLEIEEEPVDSTLPDEPDHGGVVRKDIESPVVPEPQNPEPQQQ